MKCVRACQLYSRPLKGPQPREGRQKKRRVTVKAAEHNHEAASATINIPDDGCTCSTYTNTFCFIFVCLPLYRGFMKLVTEAQSTHTHTCVTTSRQQQQSQEAIIIYASVPYSTNLKNMFGGLVDVECCQEFQNQQHVDGYEDEDGQLWGHE